MAASVLPFIAIAIVAAFALSGKKKAGGGGGSSSGSGGGATDNGEGPHPGGVEDCPDCLDPAILVGMAPALAAQVAAALASAATLGPAALLDLAAAVAKSGAPNAACAAACLKEAAGKLGGGSPPFFPGLNVPGFGIPGFGVPAIPPGMIPPGMTPGVPGMTTPPVVGDLPIYPPGPAPVVPNPAPTGPFDILLQTEPAGAPPPPFLLAPVALNQWAGAPWQVRSGDTPGKLATYYTGSAVNVSDLPLANGGASFTQTGGSLWIVGDFVTLPAHWQPYSKPKPVPGTQSPMANVESNYPPRPPVQAVPGGNF